MKATVFLGGGRITSALIAGLRIAKYRPPIIVHDRHPEKLRRLKRHFGVTVEPDLNRAVEAAHVLVIAVRPSSVRELLKQIKTLRIRRKLTAVSLAAGIPLSVLRSGLPAQWARAMPSPVCRSGRGLTALSFGRGFSSAAREEIRKLFALVGAVREIPERRFDAFTVTYSSSHGYHALAALIDAAEGLGLDRKTARLAASHALADGITSWRESKLELKELIHEAATPGGIAATVMASLDDAGYRQMVAKSLRAGLRQARKNARR